MANGRFRLYYWNISSMLHLSDEVREFEYYTSEDEADYIGKLELKITFNNGYTLRVIANLDSNTDIIEHNYYYGLMDTNGVRIKSYDDRKHHPNIPTYPHHIHRGPKPQNSSNDRAFPCDLQTVNFQNVMSRIISDHF